MKLSSSHLGSISTFVSPKRNNESSGRKGRRNDNESSGRKEMRKDNESSGSIERIKDNENRRRKKIGGTTVEKYNSVDQVKSIFNIKVILECCI